MKDRIIRVALKQLRLSGYDNLNFGGIAEELGITRANIHHHFRNKEGLAIAAVSAYVNEEKYALDSLIKTHGHDLNTFLAALEEHLVTLVTKKKSFNACVASQLVRDSIAPITVRNIALDRFREEAKDIEGLVRTHFVNNAGDECVVQDLSFKIVAMMHGIDMMAQIVADPRKLESQIRGSLSSLIL